MIYKYTSILGVLRLAVVARKREVKLHIVKKKRKKRAAVLETVSTEKTHTSHGPHPTTN